MSAISITKLYDLLSNKLGKETAENLTTFIENKINIGLESKTQVLATKDDLSKATLAMKDDLAKTTLAMKDDLAKATLAMKDDLSKAILAMKDDLARATLASKDELSMLRENMTTLATKEELFGLREDIVKIDGKIDSKIDRSKSEMVRWMFVFWASQMILTFGFVLLFLRK